MTSEYRHHRALGSKVHFDDSMMFDGSGDLVRANVTEGRLCLVEA